MLKILDAYTVKARYYPALLATIPGLTALAILISWSRFGLTTIIASTAVPVLVFASADVARRLGKHVEERIYEKPGGKPSVTMLRYSDNTFDAASNGAIPGVSQFKDQPTGADRGGRKDRSEIR
jgi:hypothetical protein